MAGISGISGGGQTLSLAELLAKDGEDSLSILSTSKEAAAAAKTLADRSAGSKKARNAYGISASSGIGQAALNKALSEIGTRQGKVTFKDISEHQKQLEAKFSADMRAELLEAGVSLETEFILNMDSNGTIEVLCDDPAAKEKIQSYLKENPKMCEQFGYIQALANLDRAKQSPIAGSQVWQSVHNSKKEIQAQAVELFFSDALSSGMSYSSLLATFNPIADSSLASSSVSFYAGIDYTI